MIFEENFHSFAQYYPKAAILMSTFCMLSRQEKKLRV